MHWMHIFPSFFRILTQFANTFACKTVELILHSAQKKMVSNKSHWNEVPAKKCVIWKIAREKNAAKGKYFKKKCEESSL